MKVKQQICHKATHDLNHPWEYDSECKNWKFVDIKNGTMLNCYPEIIIHKDKKLLSMIKEY